MKVFVNLSGIEALKKFVNNVSNIPADIDAIHGRYIIDAKSMLGLMSLDLSRPVELDLHSEDPVVIDKFKDLVSEYR